MSSITEQFSAVTKSQLEAQFHIFNTLAHTAVDSAEKLIALHLNAGKASVETSSAAAKKLLEVKDAKELFNVTRDAPTGLDSLLAYSRELFAIASGAQAELIKSTRTPLQQVQQSVVQPAAKAATEAVATAAPAVATAAAVVAPAARSTIAEPAAEPGAAPAAAAVAAPVAAPVAAAAAEPAPVATNIHDAVASTVAADAEAAPLAATVAPTPAADIKPGIKPSFPPPKAIPVAADSKASKLKAVPPKAKQAEIPASKQKK
jgi:phasin family protein